MLNPLLGSASQKPFFLRSRRPRWAEPLPLVRRSERLTEVLVSLALLYHVCPKLYKPRPCPFLTPSSKSENFNTFLLCFLTKGIIADALCWTASQLSVFLKQSQKQVIQVHVPCHFLQGKTFVFWIITIRRAQLISFGGFKTNLDVSSMSLVFTQAYETSGLTSRAERADTVKIGMKSKKFMFLCLYDLLKSWMAHPIHPYFCNAYLVLCWAGNKFSIKTW